MISFKGPAGAGKTTLMTEAVTAIESLWGKRVMILAPSSPSVEVLRTQGFARANTLQQFELNSKLHAVTYEPGQIVEFHRMAKGAVRRGVPEKRFKSGEQWEVLRREEGAIIIGNGGVEKQLPLDEARKFSLFEREKITLGIGDRIRFTKNVKQARSKVPQQ